jgi:hypothetical protein
LGQHFVAHFYVALLRIFRQVRFFLIHQNTHEPPIPAALCLEEGFKLFGTTTVCDTFLSLGTGFFRDERRELDDRIMSIIKMTTDISTGTQKGWEDVLTRLSDSHLHSSAGVFRINPQFDMEISLDDVAALPLAEAATAKFLESNEGKSILHRTALRLLASCFYFVASTTSEDAKSSFYCSTQGHIVVRIELSQPLLEKVMLLAPQLFDIRVDETILNANFGTPKLERSESGFDVVSIPVEFGHFKQHGRVCMSLKAASLGVLDADVVANLLPVPLSGFPRDIF